MSGRFPVGRRRSAGPASAVVGTVTAALAGALSWTAAEYGLHRFAMHELRGRGMASREHLRHHADVTYFSPASKKAASAAGATAVVLPVAVAWRGRRVGIAYTAGLIGMYFGYEVAHRRCHTHAPATAYGRWMRRNHLHHHVGAPMKNFGVTVGAFDRLFGTSEAPGTLTVPRRMAPVWLLDDQGTVRPEFAPDYVVRAPRPDRIPGDRAQATRDHDAAFANLPPDADDPAA